MVLVRLYLAVANKQDALGLRISADNTISKCEGAARCAGLADGDRIVSVGDVKVTNGHHRSAMELVKNWSKMGRIAIEVRRDEPSDDKQDSHGKKRKAASIPVSDNSAKKQRAVQADDDKADKQERSKAPAEKQKSKQTKKVEPAKTGKDKAKAGKQTALKLPVGKPGCQRCAHLETDQLMQRSLC